MIPQQAIKPRFEVEAVDDTVMEKRVVRKDGRNIEEQVEVPYGFNVYFPAGHSIRVKDEDELKRLGFDHAPELIDENGDVVGTTQMSLKRHSQRRAGASKRRADTGSIDANQEG